MPIEIAAIVIVIISSGIFKIPIKPKIKLDANIFGKIPIKLNLIDLNRIKNIINIANKTNPKDLI